MRRTALALVLLVLAVAFAAGCGGEEEVTPTPDTVSGSLPTETEPTETEPTETESEPTETETTQPPAEGDAAAGKEIFLGSSGCSTCHTLSDAGTTGTTGPNLDDVLPDLSEADIKQSIEDPDAKVTEGFQPGIMPRYGETLSEEQIDALVKYLTEVKGG